MPTTWSYWCDSTTTSTATTNTWLTWTMSGTSTSTSTAITSDTAWYTWTSSTVATNVTYVSGGVALQRTAEEQAADAARREAERVAVQQRAAEAAEQRRLACEAARRLLLSMLDVQQREQLQRERFFEVIARHSKRRYRIREGSHGNVKLLNETGCEVTSYCGQPNGVPTDDSMLAQKLQLEHDEAAFLRVANATPRRAVA